LPPCAAAIPTVRKLVLRLFGELKLIRCWRKG